MKLYNRTPHLQVFDFGVGKIFLQPGHATKDLDVKDVKSNVVIQDLLKAGILSDTAKKKEVVPDKTIDPPKNLLPSASDGDKVTVRVGEATR